MVTRRAEQPSELELRREGRRRLLIGGVLFLLMLTLVSMASLLGQSREAAKDSAQTTASGVTATPALETTVAANEPLGDTSAPVAAAVPKEAVPVARTTPAPLPEEGRLVVPDLQPDPQLQNSAARR